MIKGRTSPSLINVTHECQHTRFQRKKQNMFLRCQADSAFWNFFTLVLMGHIQEITISQHTTSGLRLEPHLNKTVVMLKAEEQMLFNYLSSSLCYFDGFCSIASEFSVCLFYNYWMTTCSTATSIRF